MVLNFHQFATEAETFIRDLAGELGYPDDRNRAARVLKSVLHTMRDIIPPEESVEFMAQLPMFLKAVYVEGWTLSQDVSIRSQEEFMAEVRRNDGNVAARDFADEDDVSRSVSVVFMMLHRYVSLGEMEDIRAVLPKKLKPLLNDVLMI